MLPSHQDSLVPEYLAKEKTYRVRCKLSLIYKINAPINKKVYNTKAYADIRMYPRLISLTKMYYLALLYKSLYWKQNAIAENIVMWKEGTINQHGQTCQ